eukprot:GDKH01012123.1.p3 GENE.GDKH01012123.1~~GDKH01012123.1.p3  ORF type:complete len:128 (-),score=24.69 GDKH01012123.1:315-698(-)
MRCILASTLAIAAALSASATKCVVEIQRFREPDCQGEKVIVAKNVYTVGECFAGRWQCDCEIELKITMADNCEGGTGGSWMLDDCLPIRDGSAPGFLSTQFAVIKKIDSKSKFLAEELTVEAEELTE